jgi:protocatechuate 3,4-dioxygenase alpha subunit
VQDKGLTPSQTVGPFFKYGLTPNGKYDWNDAFTNNLVTADPSGERLRIEGRVFDGDGQPVPDCMLEIWQADAQGRFSDPKDKRALPNSAFRGFGRCGTDGTEIIRSTPSGRARCPIPTAGRRRRISCLRCSGAAC